MKNKEQYLDLPNDFYINKDGEMASEITLKQLNDILDYVKNLQQRIITVLEYIPNCGCDDKAVDYIEEILKGDE